MLRMLKKRKVLAWRVGLVSLLILLFALGSLQSSESTAWFEVSDRVPDMMVGSGTADLKLKHKNGNWVNNATAAQLGIQLPQNLYPGYQASWNNFDGEFDIKNFSTGGIDLDVYATVTAYSQDKPIQDDLQMALAWDGNATGTGFHSMKWWRNHSAMLGSSLSGARTIRIMFKLPGSAGNEVANANVKFELKLYGIQSH